MRRDRDHQRGDTIVEVLVCLAVLSVVLSGAYVVANRNAITNRSAQERLEAVKLAEAQIERLRIAAQENPTILSNPSLGVFCLPGSGAPSTTPVSSSNPACQVSANDIAVGPDVTPRYRIEVSRVAQLNPVGIDGARFRVAVSWLNVSGTGDDTLDTYYEVYR